MGTFMAESSNRWTESPGFREESDAPADHVEPQDICDLARSCSLLRVTAEKSTGRDIDRYARYDEACEELAALIERFGREQYAAGLAGVPQ
jgi:hypothetical protein